jgi:ribosomal-protein-alanine N-acetyltransferase
VRVPIPSGHSVAVVHEITIRDARPEDEEAWIDLYESVAAERRWIGGEPPINRTEMASTMRRLSAADDAALVLGECDGVVVAWINLFFLDESTVTLGMGVAASHRGRGIGSALVTTAIDWAHTKGATRLWLEVFPHNEAARALYRSMGFQESETLVGRYPRQSGEVWDAVVMVRSLADES